MTYTSTAQFSDIFMRYSEEKLLEKHKKLFRKWGRELKKEATNSISKVSVKAYKNTDWDNIEFVVLPKVIGVEKDRTLSQTKGDKR